MAELRATNPGIQLNAVGADLARLDLSGADLSEAHLAAADLSYTNLSGAELSGANLAQADLRGADLRSATLGHAVNLDPKEVASHRCAGGSVAGSILVDADLRGANLRHCRFQGTELGGSLAASADFSHAIFFRVSLSDVDLGDAIGLNLVQHMGPSTLGSNTLLRSKGRIPEVFLRGCGLQDWEIEVAKLYNPDLSRNEITNSAYEIVNLKSESAIMAHSLFISYSHKDSSFVKRLERGFDDKRIRYWRDAHNMKAGRLETQIDRAIRLNPIFLLVLSRNSVESDWVEWEISRARKLEKTEKRDVLCPVALDDSWKTCSWPGPIAHQIVNYNILDFSADFDSQFEKLVSGIAELYPPVAKEIEY